MGAEGGDTGSHSKPPLRDLPGSPVVKTSPSSAEGVGLIPGWGAKIPRCLVAREPKQKKDRSNIVTNSVKTVKMVHIKTQQNTFQR